MVKVVILSAILVLTVVTAFPHDLKEGLSHVNEGDRYNPDVQNGYRLFTRRNPQNWQTLVIGNVGSLTSSFYDRNLRTIVLVHGWQEGPTGDFVTVMVPTILNRANVNVLVVDWQDGADTNYIAAMRNTVNSGEATARFISWMVSASGAPLSTFHLIGNGLGAQKVGIIGRNLGGQVGYITGLNPGLPGWEDHPHGFRSTDGEYTEVIHEASQVLFEKRRPLGDVHFYIRVPIPGCVTQSCSEVYNLMARSIQGHIIMGNKCEDYQALLAGRCNLPETLPLGGLEPKTGASGIYLVSGRSTFP